MVNKALQFSGSMKPKAFLCVMRRGAVVLNYKTKGTHQATSIPSRANKGGQQGCTPEQKSIGNAFVVHFLNPEVP